MDGHKYKHQCDADAGDYKQLDIVELHLERNNHMNQMKSDMKMVALYSKSLKWFKFMKLKYIKGYIFKTKLNFNLSYFFI